MLRAMGEAKPGLVYTATRKSAERYAEALAELGLSAAAYHAGLRARDRDDAHSRFLGGGLDVVVATTAFGMGIDKADVRFVLHAEVADSLDSYCQEIGRAGRDGEPATTVLFYRPQDLGLRAFFAGGSADETNLQKLVTLVNHAPDAVEPTALAQEMDLPPTRLSGLVNLLEQAGAIDVHADGRIASTEDDTSPREAAVAAADVAAAHQRVERSRVDMMRAYAETTGCRRQFLLGYFGETLEEPCGRCDTCEAGTARELADAADSPYPLQSRVRHTSWGQGVVMRYEGDRIVVLFDEVGYRTLSLDAVSSRGLLSGLSAASWLARYRRSVVVVDSGEHRADAVERSHGYLGRDPQVPSELIARGREEVLVYPTAQVRPGRVERVRRRPDGLF